MDFQGAINAHVAWKMKLSKYLRSADGSLDPILIERDDGCELGRWMKGEGAVKCGNKAPFVTLLTEHARFHKAAAEIVRKANAGLNVTDETALGGGSPFTKASTAVVAALMDLRRICG